MINKDENIGKTLFKYSLYEFLCPKKIITEYKAIVNLKPLSDDKGKFRQWNVKLINALEQVNPIYKKLMDAMRKT